MVCVGDGAVALPIATPTPRPTMTATKAATAIRDARGPLFVRPHVTVSIEGSFSFEDPAWGRRCPLPADSFIDAPLMPLSLRGSAHERSPRTGPESWIDRTRWRLRLASRHGLFGTFVYAEDQW